MKWEPSDKDGSCYKIGEHNIVFGSNGDSHLQICYIRVFVVFILAKITSSHFFHSFSIMCLFPALEQFFRLPPADAYIFCSIHYGNFFSIHETEQCLQITCSVVTKAFIIHAIAVDAAKSDIAQKGRGSSSSSSPETFRLHTGNPCLWQKLQI